MDFPVDERLGGVVAAGHPRRCMREKMTAVLDCGEATVAWSLFRRAGDSLWLVSRQVEPLGGPAATAGEWGGEVAAALARMRPRCPGRRPVVATVPATQLLVRTVRVEESGRRAAAALRAAAEEALPCPLAEVECEAVPTGGGEFLLVAARTAAMNELCAVIARAGFALADLVPAPLGLARLARGQTATRGDRLVLSLGARSGTLVGVDAGGWVLRSFLFDPAADGPRRPEAVGREVARSLAFLAAQGRVPAAAGIELVEEFGDVGPELARSTGRWVVPLAAPVRRDDAAVTGAVTLAAGAAWLAQEKAGGTISLLPAGERLAPDPRRRPSLAIAAAVLGVALAAANLHCHQLLQQVRLGSADLATRLAGAAGLDGAIQAGRRRLEVLRRDHDELTRVEQRRDGWVRLLVDLGGALDVLEHTRLDRLELLPPAAAGRAKPEAAPRLRLAGWLAGGGTEAGPRALALLGAVGALPAVDRVERQRFDVGAEITRFELVVALSRHVGI